MPVQLGPWVEDAAAVADDEVRVRRRDIDVPGLDRLQVFRVSCREVPGALEDLRERARCRRGNVEDDEQSRRKVVGQLADQVTKRFDAARRRTDRNRVEAAWVAGLGQDVLRSSLLCRSYALKRQHVTVGGPFDCRIERELARAVDDDEPPRS